MNSPPAEARINSWEALRERIGQDARYPRWLLTACLVGLLTTSFPITILTVAIVPIAHDLHTEPTTITWVTTAPMLASAVATPILGRLGDLRGHRRIYLFGLVTAGAFALLTAFSWNATTLIAFRTLSQVGAAAIVPTTYAMFFRALPPERRLRSASMATGASVVSATTGLIVGGPLIDLIGWRPIFFVQTALAALALAGAVAVLQRTAKPVEAHPVDYKGAFALAVATFTVTFAIDQVAVVGMTPAVIAAFAVFPVASLAVVLIERRVEHPLLPLQVLTSANARVVMGASFLSSAGFMGSFVNTPLMLQSGMGYSTGIASLATAPRGTSMFLVSGRVAGAAGQRLGIRRLILVSSFALAAITVVMAFGTDIKSLPIILVSLVITGAIYGLLLPSYVTTMANSVADSDIGIAASLQQTTNAIGQVVGISVCTSLAANSTRIGPYAGAYLISAGMIAVAAVLGFLVRDVSATRPTARPIPMPAPGAPAQVGADAEASPA